MRYLKCLNSVGRNFPGSFTKRKRLGLGEDVCHQEIVVPPQRIEGLVESDKVAGYQFGPLVDELVEGVLSVGTRLSPDDGSGLVVYLPALEIDMLSVALHIKLL